MDKPALGTILFVDDEPSLREIGRTMLSCLGFETIVAANGQECLDVVDEMKNSIDLIILDLVMPGLDGQSTLEELRRRNIKVPVVLTTGFSLNDLRGRPDNLHLAQAVITKPFDMDRLKKVIAQVLPGRFPTSGCRSSSL